LQEYLLYGRRIGKITVIDDITMTPQTHGDPGLIALIDQSMGEMIIVDDHGLSQIEI
jgi:hypothetical protein